MSNGLDELKVLDELKMLDELNEPKLNYRASKKHRSSRLPLPALSKTSVVILIVLTTLMALFGLLISRPIIIVIAGVMALITALVIAGIRWAPLLGSLIGCVVLYIFTVVSQYPLYHLSHPKDVYGTGAVPVLSFVSFVMIVLIFWCTLVLVLAGIAAVFQNYFQQQRSPTWFKTALGTAIGVLCGVILLGALIQPATATASTTNPNATPTVHLGAGAFTQSSITISKGSRLVLVDDGKYQHNISNGTWKNGQPAFENQTGEPLVKSQIIDASGASLTIGPFNTAGTYHLFCSIHENMTLTITVQ